MIPSINVVLSVEMIRDGGSLAATFLGSDGCEYWVFLPVRINKLASGEWQRTGYEEPVILDRLTQRNIPITWQHAQIFLAQMLPLLRNESDLKWHAIMTEALSSKGALPSGVDRDYGRSSPSSKSAKA
jgi:hypothetical protein